MLDLKISLKVEIISYYNCGEKLIKIPYTE